MTINDMIEQGIHIEGKAEVRQWKNGDMVKQFEYSEFEFSHKSTRTAEENELFDIEIAFMFCVDNTLVIEVKEQEE